jgi:GNAT superfamily N-acetyltransferase
VNEALFRRVEDAGLNASAPPQQRWLDGWIVRLSPGKAKRARCVNAVAAGVRPLEGKLEECAGLYREAGLPFFVRITPFSQPDDLDERLARLGWSTIDDTRVMVLPSIDALPDRAALPPGVESRMAGPAEFADAVGTLRGAPPSQRMAHAERLAASPVPYLGMVWRRDGETVACGQVAREGAVAGLYDIFTAPVARGQGLAGLLCGHLLCEARSRGARVAYLQVESDNTSARAVYHRLGFADGYAYHYRCAEAGAH